MILTVALALAVPWPLAVAVPWPLALIVARALALAVPWPLALILTVALALALVDDCDCATVALAVVVALVILMPALRSWLGARSRRDRDRSRRGFGIVRLLSLHHRRGHRGRRIDRV